MDTFISWTDTKVYTLFYIILMIFEIYFRSFLLGSNSDELEQNLLILILGTSSSLLYQAS